MTQEIVNFASGPNYQPYGWLIDSTGAGLVTGNLIISGNITIGSVSANVDSIYIQSGANIDLGSAWTNIGSVLVTNGASIGSFAIQNIAGSVAITNSLSITGSIQPYNPIGIGSVDPIDRIARLLGTLPYSIGSAFYTALGSIASTNLSTYPLDTWAIQVVGSNGAASAWDVRVEGSLDNKNFTQIIAHTNVDGDGVVKWSAANIAPSSFYRSRVAGLTLGVGPVGLWVYTLGTA